MKKRNITALFLALALAVTALASCADNNADPANDNQNDSSETNETVITDYSVLNAPALTVYVDASVQATGDGSESTPYKSITEANEFILSLIEKSELPQGGIKVLVAPGNYYIPNGLQLGANGYGTEECPIVYESTEPHGAVLTAGTVIDATKFEALNEEEKARILDKEAAEKIVKIDLSAQGYTKENWGEIYPWGRSSKFEYHPVDVLSAEFFCDGERMNLAQWPNEGWLLTTGRTEKCPAGMEGEAIIIGSEVASRVSQYQTFDDVWVYGLWMHTWSDASIPVVGFNYKTLVVEHEPHYGIDVDNKRYYYFNVFEELDVPGEYYLDRNAGILYYYPINNASSSEIVMTDSSSALISGNATYVTFRGFDLEYTKGNAVNISGDHIMFDNCKISNVRISGMNLNGTNITVQNCEITETGEYGIRINGGDVNTLTKANNLIYNNYIHDWSKVVTTFCGGVEILDGSCGITVSHNELARSSYYAINYRGAYHTIEYNEIYDVMQNASDGGAICSGRTFTSYGTVIRYNYVHDIGGDPEDTSLNAFRRDDQEALGIYLDDGLSGITIYGNIVENTATYGIMIGGGRDHNIYNNIIINPGQDAAIRYDCRILNQVFNGNLENYNQILATLEKARQSEAWNEAFPHLSELILDATGYERNNPMLFYSPANSNVINNIVYKQNDDGYPLYRIDDPIVYEVSNVTNNEIIYGDLTSEFTDYTNGNLTLKDNAQVFSLLPDFQPIPFNEIGRVTE